MLCPRNVHSVQTFLFSACDANNCAATKGTTPRRSLRPIGSCPPAAL